MPVVTAKELQQLIPKLQGERGERLIARMMHWFSADKVNDLYDRTCHLQGADCAGAMMRDIGVDYQVGYAERLESLPEGAFITVSNHPYGHIDGMMLIDLMGHVRPDYKVMVNEFLARIRTLSPNFISVVPKGNEETGPQATSLGGIRETLARLRDGHPVGFFPSGAVSDLSLKEHCVRDREWQTPLLRVIQKANVPVIPIRFFDGNSKTYYRLGLIHWKVRLLKLLSEVFNKRGATVRLGIGEPIPPERQAACGSVEELGALLRRSVYDMPLPDTFKKRSEFPF